MKPKYSLEKEVDGIGYIGMVSNPFTRAEKLIVISFLVGVGAFIWSVIVMDVPVIWASAVILSAATIAATQF